MPASQCLGRLVRDTRGVGLLSFVEGGVFHIPFRCDSITRTGDLCAGCVEKERKTAEKVRGITGTTIQGMLPSYLNGRVTEPIPFWSRLYDGAWYRLKIEAGCTVSEDVMARAKKAAEVAYEGVATVPPQPMPGKVRAKKAAAPAPATPVAPPTPLPVQKARRIPIKESKPVATLETEELPVESIEEVHVRCIEIDGRSLYLDPRKEKVYDLKFKYLGRLKDGQIHSFPDSDADL
jgi:hypothetical protein